ncbi:uncharacterized protein BX663DRAFT_527788 [Cokeromyces recurvatus]|uniref:uncharacterized protein n=1 Tax=Cokeromyces recurvatus TaxID=90255 RepID=UPI00222044D0|nr:uncharacterized protein BX663DRAFT_527788 [Cokeromyces recurvatus]KAI7897547.1 hypothetical protein BX663DRAFT_527788 [Cokeromyces recurvatus]
MEPRCRRFYLWMILIVLVISFLIFFCWPRTFKIRFNKAGEKIERVGDPADWGPSQQPWLRASWKLNLTLDNTVNWIPTYVKELEFVLMDRDTHSPFAWSSSSSFLLKAQEEVISPVFRVNYEPPSVEDPTFKNLYNACGPQMPSELPILNVTLQAGKKKRGMLVIKILIKHISYSYFRSFVVLSHDSTSHRWTLLSF